MGCLRLVCSLKLQVSFAEYRLFYRALLQKRPIIVRSLLIIATPYLGTVNSIEVLVNTFWIQKIFCKKETCLVSLSQPLWCAAVHMGVTVQHPGTGAHVFDMQKRPVSCLAPSRLHVARFTRVTVQYPGTVAHVFNMQKKSVFCFAAYHFLWHLARFTRVSVQQPDTGAHVLQTQSRFKETCMNRGSPHMGWL